MTYFTSDTHFGHANIIKFCNRPFATAREMDEALINNWNSKITKNDTVYHLGDFALGCSEKRISEIIYELNFEHLHVIKGNHERSFAGWYRLKKPFNVSFYGSYLETKIDGLDFTLCHYPIVQWNKCHYGAYHLFGHVHGGLPQNDERSLDVGADTNNYFPYSLDNIVDKLKNKSYKIHHK